MTSNRPTRTIRPAQKLNGDNIGELQLASHRNFVKAAKDPKKSSLSSPNPDSEPSTQGSSLVTDSVPASDKCRTTSVEPDPPDNDLDNDFESQPEATKHQLNKNAGMSTSPSFFFKDYG